MWEKLRCALRLYCAVVFEVVGGVSGFFYIDLEWPECGGGALNMAVSLVHQTQHIEKNECKTPYIVILTRVS